MSVFRILIHFFSHRATTAIIFLIAISTKLLQIIFFYNSRVDASFQLRAAKNFIAGNGISLDSVSAPDLSQTIFTPLINWPPGYSLLMVPFLAVAGNYTIAALVLSGITAVTTLWLGRSILKALDCPLYIQNLGLLFLGCYIYSFYQVASSDGIAIPFFLFPLLIAIKIMNGQKISLSGQILFTSSLLVFASLKYLLMPLSLILPVVLFYMGFRHNRRDLFLTGLRTGTVLALGIIVILLYQKSVGGSATYISQPERSFYPENLAKAFPYIPDSFLKINTVEQFLPFHKNMEKAYLFIHLITFILIALWTVKLFLRQRFKQLQTHEFFYFLSGLVTLCLSFVLIVLSLRVGREEIFPGLFWTYVGEARYYGPAVVCIQLCGLLFIARAIRLRIKWKLTLTALIILSLITEIARGMYFGYNRIRNFSQEEYSWQYEDRFQKMADVIIKAHKNPGETAVITGSSYYMNNRVNLYSGTPILDNPETIVHPDSLKTGKPVVLLLILQEREFHRFENLLRWNQLKKAGKFQDYHFFIVHVRPS